MADIKLTPQEIERAMDFWGCSPEERKTLPSKLTPYQKRFIKHLDDFCNYKIIAEVKWQGHCAMGAKVGGKIVFSALGEIIPEECTAFPPHRAGLNYCSFAVQEMLPFIHVVQDRIMSGCANPSPMGIDYIKCIDMEPARGGTGEVRFSIYCVKEKVKVPKGMYRIKVGS
jgi:uncharacterized repeat protein (TIGR04076 family)